MPPASTCCADRESWPRDVSHDASQILLWPCTPNTAAKPRSPSTRSAIGRRAASDPKLPSSEKLQSRHSARLHVQSHLLRIGLFGPQAIVFVTNALTDLVQQSSGAQHRKVAGFMAEFSTEISYGMRTVNPDHKLLSVFFSNQFRPQAPDMACDFVRSTLR